LGFRWGKKKQVQLKDKGSKGPMGFTRVMQTQKQSSRENLPTKKNRKKKKKTRESGKRLLKTKWGFKAL